MAIKRRNKYMYLCKSVYVWEVCVCARHKTSVLTTPFLLRLPFKRKTTHLLQMSWVHMIHVSIWK